MMFDFCGPFGWEELSSVATAVAVLLALLENHKTTKQMQDSLRIQEQAKNLELFDKRINVIHIIETDQKLSKLEVRLLFDQDIVDRFNELQKFKAEKEAYCDDLSTYKFLIEEACEMQGEPSPVPDICTAKWMMEQSDFHKEYMEKYEKICKDNEISSSYGSPNDEWRTYNYKDISDSIERSQKAIESCRSDLVSQMESFIKESIAPLVQKKDTV